MTRTLVPNFSHAAAQAQQWVNELAEELGWGDRQAYHLLKSVMTTLRDWLSQEEAADLSSQLPTLIRGIFFEGWNPAETPAPQRTKQDFLARVAGGIGEQTIDLDLAVSAVFAMIDRHISQGESAQVRASMKKTLRQLWPAH